jgi:hypothetical protein
MELNGAFILTAGSGFKTKNFQSGFKIGLGKETNTLIFIPEIYLENIFSNFLYKINLQGIFPINESKHLLLVGIGAGVKLYDIESSFLINYTLPFSAVNEIKGPIPSFSFDLLKNF